MKNRIIFFVAAALMAFPAFAQTTAPDTTISLSPLWQALEPSITTVLGVLVTAMLGWLAAIVKSKLNIDIEAKNRDALHSAIMTGVNIGISRIGGKISDINVDTRSQVVAEAVRWAETSVPGALKSFGLTPYSLSALAEAKLQQALGQSPTNDQVSVPVAIAK